jgi:hypothetical protein
MQLHDRHENCEIFDKLYGAATLDIRCARKRTHQLIILYIAYNKFLRIYIYVQ